jgi:hypothetical protein
MTAALIRPPGLIPAVTRSWVRLYCTGMAEEAKAIRQLEIESDLWEHFVDRQAEGANPADTNIEMFGRLLRGVPSDIAWRFQAEGFQMSINIPLERFAGLLLLFLIIPFMAGASIAGYDFSRDAWPGEFERFADISSNARTATAMLHGLIGLLLIAAAAMFFALLRDRSPKLVTLGAALLTSAGVVMLINAAVYRAMSALANDYLATGDESVVTIARSFGVALETLAIANMAATTSGIFAISTVLVRLAMIPRWTAALPIAGMVSLVGTATIGAAFDGTWLFFMAGFFSQGLWLLIAGGWLLFGGSKPASSPLPEAMPAA